MIASWSQSYQWEENRVCTSFHEYFMTLSTLLKLNERCSFLFYGSFWTLKSVINHWNRCHFYHCQGRLSSFQHISNDEYCHYSYPLKMSNQKPLNVAKSILQRILFGSNCFSICVGSSIPAQEKVLLDLTQPLCCKQKSLISQPWYSIRRT